MGAKVQDCKPQAGNGFRTTGQAYAMAAAAAAAAEIQVTPAAAQTSNVEPVHVSGRAQAQQQKGQLHDVSTQPSASRWQQWEDSESQPQLPQPRRQPVALGQMYASEQAGPQLGAPRKDQFKGEHVPQQFFQQQQQQKQQKQMLQEQQRQQPSQPSVRADDRRGSGTVCGPQPLQSGARLSQGASWAALRPISSQSRQMHGSQPQPRQTPLQGQPVQRAQGQEERLRRGPEVSGAQQHGPVQGSGATRHSSRQDQNHSSGAQAGLEVQASLLSAHPALAPPSPQWRLNPHSGPSSGRGMFAVDEVDVVPDSFSSHQNGLTSSSDPITHALSAGGRMDDLLIPAAPAQSASLGWRQTSALLGEPSSPDRQLSLGQSSKQSLGRQASLEHSAPLHRQTSLGLLASHSQPGSARQVVSLGLNSLSAGRPVSVGAALSVGAPLSDGAPKSVGCPISSGGPVLDGGHLPKHGPMSWVRPHSGAGTDTWPMSAAPSESFGLFEELQSALELQPAAGARSRSGGAAQVPSTAGPRVDLYILARGRAGTASHTELDTKDIGQQGATPGAGTGKGAAASGAWWEQAKAKRDAQAVREQHSGKGRRTTQPAAVAPAPAPAPRKRQAPQTAAGKAADELWDMEVPVKPARRAKRKSGEGTGAQAEAGTAAGGSGADAKPAPKRSKALLSLSDPLGHLSERLTFGGQVRWPAGLGDAAGCYTAMQPRKGLRLQGRMRVRGSMHPVTQW